MGSYSTPPRSVAISPTCCEFSCPLVITKDQLGLVVETLDEALSEVRGQPTA